MSIETLQQLRNAFNNFIVLQPSSDLALALWAIGTYMIKPRESKEQPFSNFPILRITSPDRESGKSTLRQVLNEITYNPKSLTNTTVAAIYRQASNEIRTLLIDEFDSMMMSNGSEFEAAMNNVMFASFEIDGTVERCDRDSRDVISYYPWGPRVVIGNGPVSHTLESRCMTIYLKRKLPTESVLRLPVFRRQQPDYFTELRASIESYANDLYRKVQQVEIQQDLGLENREFDRYEPLLKIAQAIDTNLFEEFLMLVLKMRNVVQEPPSIHVQLLVDIYLIFEEMTKDRLATAHILEKLRQLPESPWREMHDRPRPTLTDMYIASSLRLFNIGPRQLGDGTNKRGYFRSDFDDAYARYSEKVATPLLAT
jgi:putative DNA primase/helicase